MNRFDKYWIEELKVNSSSLENEFDADIISAGIMLKKGAEGKNIEYNAGVFPILMSCDFPPVKYSSNSTFQISEQNFTHLTHQFRKKNDEKTFDFIKTVKIVRILGLMALISYMIVILFTWIYANMHGYVYFSAGEPVLSIKYPEWLLGFLGIFVAADYLHKELKYDVVY